MYDFANEGGMGGSEDQPKGEDHPKREDHPPAEKLTLEQVTAMMGQLQGVKLPYGVVMAFDCVHTPGEGWGDFVLIFQGSHRKTRRSETFAIDVEYVPCSGCFVALEKAVRIAFGAGS